MLPIEVRGLDPRCLERQTLCGFTVAHEIISQILLVRGVLRNRT